jgi:hypothetical protein
MSKKKDSSGGKLAVTLATTGGAFVLRKLLAVVWTKVVGKEPPIDLTDPKVTLVEAVGWAVVLAAIVETARFGIARAITRNSSSEVDTAESD